MTTTPRPTIAFMRGIIGAFYELPGNTCGGSLHIVLDDFNTEDEHVEWCRNHAQEKGDVDGVYLAELLQKFTEQERNEILDVHHFGVVLDIPKPTTTT